MGNDLCVTRAGHEKVQEVKDENGHGPGQESGPGQEDKAHGRNRFDWRAGRVTRVASSHEAFWQAFRAEQAAALAALDQLDRGEGAEPGLKALIAATVSIQFFRSEFG